MPSSRDDILTDRDPVSGFDIAFAFVVAALTLGYLLPWAIASARGRSNRAAILIVNVFAGWTVIGWLVALVMACQAHAVVGLVPPSPPGDSVGAGGDLDDEAEVVYSTIDWTGDELRAVQQELRDRAVGFYMERGELVVGKSFEALADAVIRRVTGDAPAM